MNTQEDNRYTYNLLDEPWLYCLTPGMEPGAPLERQALGLRDTLRRAHEIIEITDPSPLNTIAVYRLLLAVLHRVYGPKDTAIWTALWDARYFDPDRLDNYLLREDIYPRFDLFDARFPFYQVGRIDPQYGRSIAGLTYEQAGVGDAPLLFDHAKGAATHGLTPAQAAAYLLACHAFAPSGTISLEEGQDRGKYKYASAGPLRKSAVLLVRGRTLFETLLLNLSRYDPTRQERALGARGDLAAWERTEEPRVEPRYPTGLLDLLTWQARRIRLFPERDERGHIVVRRAALMKGHPFPANYEQRGAEPMVAFTHVDKPDAGGDPYPPLGFREERALWRDSLTLFQSVPQQRQHPVTFDWLDDVRIRSRLHQSALPLDAFGMRPDPKKHAMVLAWRHERLLLPLDYLDRTNRASLGSLIIRVVGMNNAQSTHRFQG